MSSKKKQIRANFRDTCFKRDKYCCVMCGFQSAPQKAEEDLDCHHIYDRSELPNGGYVPENGISLCDKCHLKAEAEHNGEIPQPGFSRNELYAKIDSSYEKAYEASLILGYP
jgi:5-methylcytosine-specific restriction endonuclease McrA